MIDIFDTSVSKGGVRRLQDGRCEAVFNGQSLGVFSTWNEAGRVFDAAENQSAAGAPSQG
jgi:hypothetical protein